MSVHRFLIVSVLLSTVLGASSCHTGDEDLCTGVDCALHGQCRVLDQEPTCSCDPGFVAMGLVCHSDWCSALDCQHGTCVQNAEAGACKCLAGWNGDLCDSCAEGYHQDNGQCLPDEPCDSDPCIHGICLVEDNAESCDCDAGYAGDICNQCDQGYHPDGLLCVPDEANPCNPNPCTEAHRTQCAPSGDSYTCSCDQDYHEEAGACVLDQADPCNPNPCTEAHRTQCAPSGDSYTCSCDQDYHEEAGTCVLDQADPCNPNPCNEAHRSQCVPEGDSHVCNCDPDFHNDSGSCIPDCSSDSDICQAAHASYFKMVSANGHGAIGYDLQTAKVTSFLEHVYRNWDEGVSTRDLLFDSYMGIRATGSNVWLDQVDIERSEYLLETGIIHLVQRVSGFRIDTYVYAPWNLSRPAMVLMGKVTNTGQDSSDVSLYTIHNYHLGSTSDSDPVNPGFDDERIVYDTATGSYLESGPGGLLMHRPLDLASHHGCTPNNPWQALQAGADLSDDSDSGLGNDRVAGFQKDFHLDPGQSGWFGVLSAFDRWSDEAALVQDVQDALSGLSSQSALSQELDSWEQWRADPPEGLCPAELFVWRQSEALLRQGQVWETSDLSRGQIVASLPPGAWNICWVRDMAYAVMALVRTGHLAEARAALEFVLSADSGNYQDYVGVGYQVSITRYFGRGKEETDINAHGPNIEFDGFGLFLWTLAEYTSISGDTSLVDDNWTVIRDKIAGALVSLVDSQTGMLQADSSIWEVHWNGMQKRHSFTSLAAAKGLCAASAMASAQGEDTLAAEYSQAALGIRDALATNCTDGNKVLASSYEELVNNLGYHDMAVVEALNWLLFDPSADTAAATLGMFDSNLRVASGLGFFRNDDGGWYDSQEWVFTDLRASSGFRLAGNTTTADRLLGWVTAQALFNHGMIAELYQPENGDYEGETPMVGFGAGAYILAIMQRESPASMEPACGSWEAR